MEQLLILQSEVKLMKYEYILKIANKNFYREVQISEAQPQIKIGTELDCNIRFYKELFFTSFCLDLIWTGDTWQLMCSDNVYISVGDIRKLVTKDLEHGDAFTVRYVDSDIELLKCDFSFDFDNEEKEYDRVIDLADNAGILFGSNQDCDIRLDSDYVSEGCFSLERCADGLRLNISNNEYGIYHNGKLAQNGEIIHDMDFISIADCSFYYTDNKLKTSKNIHVKSLRYYDEPDKNTYPKFNRNTRIKSVIDEEKIEVLDPPAIPQKPKNNIITRLLPSIVMVGAALVMGVVSGGGMIIFSVISGLMGVVTGIVSLVENKKEFKKNTEERIKKYNAYVENKKIEIEAFRLEEKQVLEDIYIGHNDELENYECFSSDLFDRAIEDEDFLSVRLGTGQIESKKIIDIKKQEKLEVEDELQEMPKQIYEKYKYLDDAPVVCDFKESKAVGIIGNESERFSIMKSIVIDICARHYHSDVKLFFVAEEWNKELVNWLRFLPHVNDEATGIRNIVCDDESKNLIFEFLYKELTARAETKKFDEYYVIFLYDEYGFKNHPISKFIDNASELGVTFVFFGYERADIMQGCNYIINALEGNKGVLIDTNDKTKCTEFVYPDISYEQAKSIVALLAPVYTEEISLEGTLTKNISLFNLLNIIAVDDIDLTSRWKSSRADKSMAAPVGVSKSGVISLDLHDKAHGPHGLVAGTTGSGKSEILQTYILSMSLLYHPHEVGFVIIDFKGGGMVNQFEGLPHLMGAITNIDGREIERSLKSIKAELQKRQRLFADADVNHIDKYIRKYRSREVATPLPHLIIIVDEFAELKAEQPEFMKELISAARIGRSLGVHLILATQKPSGQVNEQIWSNSRFKLCLKVQSQEDSNEVLKSPLAAEIKEAGRAYLQVGNNEIFELFQSAYSGAPEKMDDSNLKEFAIYSMTEAGKRISVYEQKKNKASADSKTQLSAIVDYVSDYCRDKKIAKLPDICLPSLPHMIEFPNILRSKITDNNSVVIDLGIYDDPDQQYQGKYSIDLTTQNVMIIGSAQTGKTNVLQNMIRNIAMRYTPEEAAIYIIDFASMVLKNFETLNHVGGVVTASEDEKLKNLMKLLYTEIETRKEKLLSVGVSSFAAYKEAGMTDLPQIILMIDNLTALKELYFQDDDELLRLCREGTSVGISIVIANSQTAGIGYKYLANFSTKIALFCNDSSEYSSLFDHCRERIENIQGRCIVEIDKTHLECQTFIAFNGDKEIERANNIRKFVSDINAKTIGRKSASIPVIPEVLSADFVRNNLKRYMGDSYKLVAGLDYATVSPFILEMNNLSSPLVITGREGAGRHNFIKYAVNMLEEIYPNKTEVYIFDGLKRQLSVLNQIPSVRFYDFLETNVENIMLKLEEELCMRYERLRNGDEQILKTSELLLLIINNSEILTAINNNTAIYNAYKNIIGKYKNMNVCVIVGDYENTNISYMAPEIIRNLKDARHFMYFDDVENLKLLDLPLSVIRGYKKAIDNGDCYYIKDNNICKIKTAIR